MEKVQVNTNLEYSRRKLADENDMILAGHGRKAAGEMLGVEEVPVMIIRGLSPAQKARLCISENQIALNAGWDLGKLSEQLQLILDDGLDLEITGFDDDFLNDILKLDNDNELLDPLEGEKNIRAWLMLTRIL